jgi:hypothetical protein
MNIEVLITGTYGEYTFVVTLDDRSSLDAQCEMCYSASSEKKLLLHKLMCIVLSVVMP